LIFPLVQSLTTADGREAGLAGYLNQAVGLAQPSFALVLGATVFAIFLTKALLAVAFLRWNLGFVLMAEARVGARLFSRYLRAPYEFHLVRSVAELQRTLSESVRLVYQEAMGAVLPALADLLLMVVIGLALLVIAPAEAVIGGIYFAIVAFAYQRLIHGPSQQAGAAIHERAAPLLSLSLQALTSVKEIQLTDSASEFAARLLSVREKLANRQRAISLAEQLPRYYLEVALLAGMAILAAVALIRRGEAEGIAVLGLFLAAGFRLIPSLNRVLVAANKVRAAEASLDQILSDLRATTTSPAPAAPLTGPVREIAIEQVSYSYPGQMTSAIRAIDLRARSGESIAFVGESGSGKTTLVNVLLGLLAPQEGQVLVNGDHEIRSASSWGGRLAYVPQDIAILNDTLKANVAFGISDRDVDEARIVTALEQAELTSVVAALPCGVDTVLGDRGIRLSGGQRQRVALARAFYMDPDVLVLDEATSALDNETEHRVMLNIEASTTRSIVFMIAHRLSTVRRCSRIVYLSEGVIHASGTFDELATESPGFSRLASLGDLAPAPRAKDDAPGSAAPA
jgi:ABC-type multidrug transport system fused ATPase/permease subunit